MADPATVSCDSACTVTLQVEISNPLFAIDEAGGAAIGGAILLVWATGWAFRQVIRVLRSGDNPPSESE